jgi:glycosyltransferase involved in cell wall biosynthesis
VRGALRSVRILLFEERAHLDVGHYPGWVARITRALDADGHEVHVLTRHGWLYGRPVDHSRATYRMTRRHRVAGRIGTELRRLSLMLLAKRGRRLGYLGDALRNAMLVAAVRHRARRLGGAGQTPVIILSRSSPIEIAMFAPRDARWLVYSHEPPGRIGGAMHYRRARAFAAGQERRRRRRGGHVRVVVNNVPVREAWRAVAPWFEYEVISSAGRPRVDPMPRREARRALGLPEEAPIALCFGVSHGGKDLDTVLHAFAGDEPPARLIVAGKGVGVAFDAFVAAHTELTFPAVTVIDGFVTDKDLHLLHSAADYAVLSFFASWPNDSGTMGDAVGHGLPVCCSENADHGRVVRTHRLGELFRPGDPESLRAAARRMAGATLAAEAQSSYLEEFDPETQSRRLLEVAAGNGTSTASRL